MQLFFSSLSELEHFTHRLKTLPKDNACEHCARNDQWVSHGYVYKQLCRNLCYASLIEAARETRKIVTITHVNNVLVQAHRSALPMALARGADQTAGGIRRVK